jgi:hypothetical protein
VPFPPLTAVLMMPAVLVLGLRHVNTVVFAAVVGGANVWMLDVLLTALHERGIAVVSRATRRWLLVCWAFGTVAFTISTQGSVWFLGHGTAVFFLLAALSAAARGRGGRAGLALGIAALGRPTTLLMLPALVGLMQHGATTFNAGLREDRDADIDDTTRSRTERRRQLFVAARQIAVPAAMGAALLLAYNWARFGRPTEFGYHGENVDPTLAGDLATYGQFSLHFVKHNLWALLAAGPTFVADRNTWAPDPQGMSVFFTTPALLYAFRARVDARLHRWLWAAVALLLVPLLSYYNTGWYQFGYRFAMDVLPVVFVLVALGLRDRVTRGTKFLIVLGVVVNFWGMAWFNGR